MKNINAIVTILLILPIIIYGQSTTLYHEFQPTASGWDVVEWNVKDTSGKTFLIKETVDSSNRVAELQFLCNGNLISDHLCYLPNRVTFEYIENTIVEKAFSGDKPLLGYPCENYHKSIYYLDSQNIIIKIEREAIVEYADSGSSEIRTFEDNFPFHIALYPDSSEFLRLDYYFYSFAKLDGLYPVSKNYNLAEDYFYGEEPETASIRKGIQYMQNCR